MPKITFLPMNQSFDVKAGETILDVALNHDIPLQHACGGFCACTTCQIRVVEGHQSLSPMEDEEQERLERVGIQEEVSRLGCQSQVLGDVVVEVVNLDHHER